MSFSTGSTAIFEMFKANFLKSWSSDIRANFRDCRNHIHRHDQLLGIGRQIFQIHLLKFLGEMEVWDPVIIYGSQGKHSLHTKTFSIAP